MIYVVARHEGQYQRWLERSGLIGGTDTKRIKNIEDMEFIPTRQRFVLLEDYDQGIDDLKEFHARIKYWGHVISFSLL